MKFEEMPHVMLSYDELKKKFEKIVKKLEQSSNKDQMIKAVKDYMKFDDHLQTLVTIITIHYSQDTLKEENVKAQDIVDEIMPRLQVYVEKINNIILNSPFRKDLEAKFGELMFKQMELALKCFKEEIVEDLQLENKLTSKYSKHMAQARISFEGKTYTLPEMSKFTSNANRQIRKKASKAVEKYFEKNYQVIGSIYDELVRVRDKIAKTLGYENFIPLAYARLGRLDYDAKMVEVYRKQIEDYFVPLSKKLFKRQMKRIAVTNPRYYDLSLNFLSGNPIPRGTPEELVNKALDMYKAMSKETGDFFEFMINNNLMDLLSRHGKQGGGYMTYLPDYKSPFIFANFNGTSGDVEVLTHEVGHAYQGYCARDIQVSSYRSPTLEACEIHSMSMEFFTWPWMNKFFDEDANKYCYAHLKDAVMFLPYGASVDEFQHFVYENPNISHLDRCKKWREIEKKYTPYKSYRGSKVFEMGNLWIRQSHIIEVPFYYIDYTLAQVAAFQFLVEMRKNYSRAWNKYNKLCKLGGKYPFVELLKVAHLNNPFEAGSLKKIVKQLNKILSAYDDLNM